jgi:hypothetical protein
MLALWWKKFSGSQSFLMASQHKVWHQPQHTERIPERIPERVPDVHRVGHGHGRHRPREAAG